MSAPTFLDSQESRDTQPRIAVHPLLDGHAISGDQTWNAVESSSDRHIPLDNQARSAIGPSSLSHAPDDTRRAFAEGPSSGEGQDSGDDQWSLALPGSTSGDHRQVEAQSSAVAGSSSPHAIDATEPRLHARGGDFSEPVAIQHPQPKRGPRRGPILSSGYLMLLSDSLDDIEALRIATENRVRSLTRSIEDSDGEVRGLGLDARSPEVASAMAMLDSLKALEHQTTLSLQRELRKSPLIGWVKRSKGVGEKQAARLLAVIGDPYWNGLHDRPRTVSELWAYAGYSVVGGEAQRRRKGQLSNWSDKAKSRAFLMAQSCVKALGGDYRAVYDAAREQYAEAVHATPCVRCGPAGKPAEAGSPLSAGHQHARALRRVSKEILRDLWIEARAVHEGEIR